MGYTKQLILSCFLLIRLSQVHVSTVWSGMEGFFWKDKSVQFTLPVSCSGFEKYREGDDFFRTVERRGSQKSWEMKIVKKIVVEDKEEEFSCY